MPNSSESPTKHASSSEQGGEFTICGMAYDAFESGDADEPILFIGSGEKTNCEHCLRSIRFIYDNYTASGKMR